MHSGTLTETEDRNMLNCSSLTSHLGPGKRLKLAILSGGGNALKRYSDYNQK